MALILKWIDEYYCIHEGCKQCLNNGAQSFKSRLGCIV